MKCLIYNINLIVNLGRVQLHVTMGLLIDLLVCNLNIFYYTVIVHQNL